MTNQIDFNYKIPYVSASNKIEYQERTTKVAVRISENIQYETTYTYDKHGRLINSDVRSKTIGEV